MKDKEGTIETLERQLVQAGIKMKIGEAGTEIRKDVLETEAQQKLMRGLMKGEFEKMKAEMKASMKESNETPK
jgi:translation initiation factor IF-2